MSDYISRDEIFSVWRSMPKPASISSLTEAINRTPAADVEQVRYGRWIVPPPPDAYTYCKVVCSECHKVAGKHKTVYGPNCGAKMELEDENGT